VRIGAYEVSGEVARGAMGVVYKARDPRLGREVAVKLSSAPLDESVRRRFEREVEATRAPPSAFFMPDPTRGAGASSSTTTLAEAGSPSALARVRVPAHRERRLRMKLSIATASLALAAGTALAGSPAVGEQAPELGSASWVMNDPGQVSIADLRGEVVFVEKWGVKCGPCLRLIPHVQELQEEYGERGLHIFAFEAQGHSADETARTVRERGGRDYPVSTGGAPNYRTDGGIPHGWLIGVDGTVIFEGNPGDPSFDRLLREEMEKVRFPGLGRNEFDRALRKSLKRYLKQDLAAAREEAEEVRDDERSSEAARADAEYLVARYTRIGEEKWSAAQAFEEADRYVEALAAYAWLEDAFDGDDLGDRAEERIEALEDDEAVEREVDAARDLQRLLARLEGQPADVRRAHLERFAQDEDYAGTRAARDAQERAGLQ